MATDDAEKEKDGCCKEQRGEKGFIPCSPAKKELEMNKKNGNYWSQVLGSPI